MNPLPFYEKEKFDRTFPFVARGTPRPNFWFPLHWHVRVEIVYILEGKLDVIIDGETRTGRRGDIVIVDTGLVHGFSNPAPGTDVRIYQFGLEIFSGTRGEAWGGGVLSPVFRRKPLVTRREDGSLHTRLEELLLEMFAEYRQKNPGFRLAIMSRLYELALRLLREVPAEPLPAGEPVKRQHRRERLEKIFSYIAAHFDEPGLSLEMAAEQVFLNKFHFSRLFKKETGQSFSEYLARIRLHRAEEYLLESETPVTDIAYGCGFNSIATFNRVFKAYMGITPSAYRAGAFNGKGAV